MAEIKKISDNDDMIVAGMVYLLQYLLNQS